MTLDDFLSDPSKLGVLGMMGIAVAALLRGWVITAGHHAAEVARLEQGHAAVISELKQALAKTEKSEAEFREMAIHAAKTADRALQAAEKVASRTASRQQ